MVGVGAEIEPGTGSSGCLEACDIPAPKSFSLVLSLKWMPIPISIRGLIDCGHFSQLCKMILVPGTQELCRRKALATLHMLHVDNPRMGQTIDQRLTNRSQKHSMLMFDKF
jgi:hypothetical protein